MTGFVNSDNLSPQFKVYLFILHTVVLGWIVHILMNVFHKYISESNTNANIKKDPPSTVRIVHVDDKRVTVESCHWLNSILNWLYMNASDTPDLLKIWLTMLNEKLKIDQDSVQFKINGIVPGSLPPTLTNVYCSSTHSNVQCVAMHIETTKLGFYISLLENNNLADIPTDVEVAITKLSGELIFQVLARQTRYDLTVKFIGDPELKVSSRDILEDSDRSAVEEKLKEVICKTVVNIPLTEGKPSEETISTNLVPESSSSCVDTDGKILVKVLKASGLTGIEKTDVPDAYCLITSKEPPQKKKTKTIKGTNDPVWNESHVLDVNEKTKEVSFDIYNELKSSEEKGFLGQVIVPLAMIGKDQSCRLILPVLPTSTENSYVAGQINLEFTYDKDGKAFHTSAEEISLVPSNVSPEEKPKTTQEKSKVVEDVRPSSPQRLVFSMATLDIVDDENDHLEFVPVVDHGIHREDIVAAEQNVAERSTYGGYETDPVLIQENQKHHEMLQELIELDRRTTPGECSKTEKVQKKREPIVNTREPPPQEATTSTSPVNIPVPNSSPEKPEETGNKPEISKPANDQVEGGQLDQTIDKNSIVLNENLMEDLTPDTKRKVFRKAFSMRINRNDETSSENVETSAEETRGSEMEKRHSFGGGERKQPKTKSGSDVSLNSLYDSTKSVLVVETREREQTKYYQIPPLMAKRGTFDHKGTKLHICNDHLFVATHFSGTLPSCSVCNLPLTGYFGKQGYECRDCHMITHKRCHYETSSVCTNSTLSSLKIVILEDKPE